MNLYNQNSPETGEDDQTRGAVGQSHAVLPGQGPEAGQRNEVGGY